MSRSRQQIWNDLMFVGFQVVPYNESFVMAHRSLLLEMDNAMKPTWWEKFVARVEGYRGGRL